jgi:hypothetical protein
VRYDFVCFCLFHICFVMNNFPFSVSTFGPKFGFRLLHYCVKSS